nr:hypothetical protein [Candidatus Sigynarchaeota archaeon]
QGFVKYKTEEYRVDPVLAGKLVTIKEIDNGKKIAIYIDNTLFIEHPKKTTEKKERNDNV